MPSKKKGAQRSGAGAEGARDDAHSNEQPDSETAAAATGLDEPASEASGYRSDVSSDDDDDVGAEGGGGDGTSGSGTSGAEAMGPDLGSDVELDPGEVAAAIRRRRQVEQEEQEQRGGAAGGGEGREGGGGGGGGGAGPLPEGELEEGHIYFFYRPKVQQQHPASLNDTARFYMILQPTARSEQQQQQQQQHQHQQQPEGKEEGEPAGGGGAGAAVGAGTAAAAAPMPGEGDAGGGGAEPPAHLASSDTAAEAREGDRPPEDKNGGGSAGGKGGGAAAQQQQPGPLPCRLLVVGKKRMPDAARHERFFGFVEAVASSVPELTSGLGERRYNTKTRGERTQPAARAAGRGMYALFSRSHGARSAPHAELAYVLQLPAGGPGPVQQELRIAEEARYVLKIKNPTGVQPPGRPSAGPEPAYSRQQMDRFEAAGTSWLDAAEDLSLLDVAGTEFVLIGAREQPLGHVDEAPAAHLLQAAQQEQQQLLQQQAEAGQQPEGQESAGADPQAGGGAAGAGAGGGGGRGGGGRGVGGKRSRGGSVGGGGGGGGDVAVSAAAEVAGGGGGGEASERTGMPAGTSPAGGGHKHRGAQAQPSKRAKVKGATAATDVAGASGGGGDGSSGGTVPESQVERKQQQAMAAKLEMEIGAVAEGSEGAGTPPGAMHADWAAEGQQRHTIVTAPAETGQWA